MENFPIDLTGLTLETKRLKLRMFEDSDLNDFYEYAKVPGVGEAAGWKHHESIQESKTILKMFIEEKKTLALVYKENGRVIGSLGLEECHYPDTYYPTLTVREIGYVLSKDYWGKGLMPEAVSRVISYCFDELGMDALAVSHFGSNKQSERVILKSGFSYLFQNEYKTRMGTIIKDNKCYLLLSPRKLVR